MNVQELILGYEDLMFHGLKFKLSKKFSKKQYDNLLKEDTHYNRVKYRDLIAEEIDEDIHVKLTYSYVSRALAIINILLTLLLIYNGYYVMPIISIAFSFAGEGFYWFFKRRAKELFCGKEMSKELVDVIFENK